MGKRLIIKDADFSDNAIGKVPPFYKYLIHKFDLTSDLNDSIGSLSISDGNVTSDGLVMTSSIKNSFVNFNADQTLEDGFTVSLNIKVYIWLTLVYLTIK